MYLFNSIALEVESDEVYCVLNLPVSPKGEPVDPSQSLDKQIKDGKLVETTQYQLAHRQGILNEDSLFESEAACVGFFADFFEKKRNPVSGDAV